MLKNLSGVSAPISTPFVNGEVAYDRLSANLQKYSQTALAGFFCAGQQRGEYVSDRIREAESS